MKAHEQIHTFGFRWDASRVRFPQVQAPDTRLAIWRGKKVLAELIHDMVALEGNPVTLPEIQTLMDGVTVGGRRVLDVQQVLNQRDAFLRLFHLVESGRFSLNVEVALALQGIAARGEGRAEGVFRDRAVGIVGTSYRPPSGGMVQALLREDFERMAAGVIGLENPYEAGIVALLHVARAQSFRHGSMRTGCLLMNGVLLCAGQDIITVPAALRVEYNKRMLAFYDDGDASEVMGFLSSLLIRSKFE